MQSSPEGALLFPPLLGMVSVALIILQFPFYSVYLPSVFFSSRDRMCVCVCVFF